MEPIEYVGIIAIVLDIIYSLPQLYKIYKTGNVSSSSIYSIYIGLLSMFLLAYYEWSKKRYINLLPIIVSFLVELWSFTKIKR